MIVSAASGGMPCRPSDQEKPHFFGHAEARGVFAGLLQRLLAQVCRRDERADALAQQVYGKIPVIRADIGGRGNRAGQTRRTAAAGWRSEPSSLHAKGRPSGRPFPFGLLLGLLGFLGSLDKAVDLRQERVGINAVHHAGLLDRLAARGRAAQAVHTDGHEQRSSFGRDIQNIADDGGLFDLCSHKK